jgi:hypothetical protein
VETSRSKSEAFQEILERKQAELARALRNRDDIIIEKSADQMDEFRRNGIWQFETWIVIPACCARWGRHYAGFATIALESVSSATKR